MDRMWIVALAMFLLGCGAGKADQGKPQGNTAGQAQEPRPAQQMVEGPNKIYDAEGRLEMEGNVHHGMRHGVWTSYFPDGRVRSRSEYREGKLEGITTTFRANGSMYYTGQHHNDKEVGEWRFFDDQGELARTVTYDTTGSIINDRAAGGQGQ